MDNRNLVKARTSGSTGTPKEIWLRRADMELSARRTMAFFNLGRNAHLFSCISPDSIGGMMMQVRADVTGARVTFEKPSNRPLSEVSADERIDLLSVVPSQMVSMLERLESLPKLGTILVGGSAIHPALRKRIAATGLNAWETYGMTETCSHIALRPITPDISIPFRTLPGITVSRSERGTLDIHGALSDDTVVHTNDLADIITPQEFLISGRADNVIVTGGKKVHPEMLEMHLRVLLEHTRWLSNADDLYISSVADPLWGEAVVLVLASSCSSSPAITDANSFHDFLKGHLRAEEIPKKTVAIKRIPLTQNGKLDRPALRRLLAAL